MPKSFRFFQDKPFLSSFLLTFSFVATSMALFRPYFYNIDDYLILLLLKGVGIASAPSEMVQHVNILLCRALVSLYKLFPHFQWYSAFQALTLFLSFWAILASLQIGSKGLFKTVLFFLSSLGMIFFFFSFMQYTQTASLAAIGGFFLLASLWNSENPRHRYKIFTLAFALILISISLRFAAFSQIVLASIPSAIYLAWGKKVTPVRLSILRFLACTAAIAVAAMSYHHYVYNRDPAWADYIRFEGPRTQLTDFQDPVYTENTKPFFDSIGWSLNDYYMFENWIYMDKDIYNYDTLKKITDYFPRFGFNKNISSSRPVIFSNSLVQTAAAFFLVFLAFLPARALRLSIANTLWLLIIFIFMTLFLKISWRVCLPPIMFLMYMNLFGIELVSGRKITSKGIMARSAKVKYALLFVSFLFSFLLYKDIYSNNRQKILKTDVVKETLKDFHPQENQLYASMLSAFPIESFPAFDDFEVFRNINLIQLSWNQRSPTTETMLEKFKVRNLLKDMVDNPNLFFISFSNAESPNASTFLYSLQTYMMEKYGIEMYLDRVFKCPLFWIFRFHSGKIMMNQKGNTGGTKVEMLKIP